MTQRNTKLLQQTMQYIKDHPEQHDQGHYWTECGTPQARAADIGARLGIEVRVSKR